MPRRRSPSPTLPTTALVASVARYPGRAARIYVPSQPWQVECYRHYSICGEARFAAKFFGHAVSRAVLGVSTLKNGQLEPVTEGPAVDALASLFNGKDGQKEMLESIGTHLAIAGECYLVGRHGAMGEDIWEVVSCIEMRQTGNSWVIDYGSSIPPVTLTETDVVNRIWLPHPERRIQADSPFRSLLPILSEIEWLTRHVFSQITSRLAGAGILFMPQEMSFPPPPDQDGVPRTFENEASAFMQTLADTMIEPIKTPGSPEATTPIVVTAPGDMLDKPRLLTFWSELDSESKELRNEAIRRFALGMDLPPEQVLGMASNGGTGGGRSTGVSHWGAWQIEEATIKLHIEPMLDVIVNALTMGYLRPAMDGSTLDVVTYDTSALRLRPDRSKEAFELWDRGAITTEALLRENGFDSADAPTPEQYQQWLLQKVALGSATPEMVSMAAEQLGVDLGPATVGTPNESRPAPSLEEHPTRPRTPSESALLVASEALVLRALERAGNRMRAQGSRPPNVPSYETHCHARANGSSAKLLEDAWGTAAIVLAGIAEPSSVVPFLDSYCQSLLAEQSSHDRQKLRNWLELAQVPL